MPQLLCKNYFKYFTLKGTGGLLSSIKYTALDQSCHMSQNISFFLFLVERQNNSKTNKYAVKFQYRLVINIILIQYNTRIKLLFELLHFSVLLSPFHLLCFAWSFARSGRVSHIDLVVIVNFQLLSPIVPTSRKRKTLGDVFLCVDM